MVNLPLKNFVYAHIKARTEGTKQNYNTKLHYHVLKFVQKTRDCKLTTISNFGTKLELCFSQSSL